MRGMLRTVRTMLLLLLLPVLPVAAAPSQRLEEDLDGDGRKETLTLEALAEGRYRLSVGRASATLDTGGQETSMEVLDVDTSDRFREVVVTWGDVDPIRRIRFYRFEDGALHVLGEVGAHAEVRGNGIVLEKTWQDFWSRTEKYVLDARARQLRRVPQELYAVGVDAQVRTSFPLLRSRTSREVVANVAPDTQVRIVAAEGEARSERERWYLVQTSTGLMGWARVETLRAHTVLPLAG
jgi:hypothetical protein